MTQSRKGMGLLLVWACLAGLSTPPDLAAYEKKVRVATDYAHVYLQPDSGSTVIGTVERGGVLALLYGGKMKRFWYHVCFRSEKTGNTKSGYVLDSEVELLYEPLLTITIREEQETLAVQYPPRNFDEMHWGDTKKQVVESEGKPSRQTKAEGSDVLVYEQEMINLECDIEYRFAANRLYQARFSFADNSQDENTCLDDYRTVKDALIRKFGKPLEENMVWRDNTYRDDFSAWGTAVGLGQLELRSRWLTPGTEIVARLAGKNQAASLVVYFTALRFRDANTKNQEED